jgi:hypothetical protein
MVDTITVRCTHCGTRAWAPVFPPPRCSQCGCAKSALDEMLAQDVKFKWSVEWVER